MIVGKMFAFISFVLEKFEKKGFRNGTKRAEEVLEEMSKTLQEKCQYIFKVWKH